MYLSSKREGNSTSPTQPTLNAIRTAAWVMGGCTEEMVRGLCKRDAVDSVPYEGNASIKIIRSLCKRDAVDSDPTGGGALSLARKPKKIKRISKNLILDELHCKNRRSTLDAG
jgi:hypothetical protein